MAPRVRFKLTNDLIDDVCLEQFTKANGNIFR